MASSKTIKQKIASVIHWLSHRMHWWYIVYRFDNFPGIRHMRMAIINRCIKKVSVIHILGNDKFTKKYVHFLNSNFDKKKHLFLCLRRHYDLKSTPFPYASNVYEIFNFDKISCNLVGNQRIIAHSLSDELVIDFFYQHQEILSHVFWFIYGGDLYDQDGEKQRVIVKKIPFIITDVDGDEQVAMKKFNITPKYFNAAYSFPITLKMIEEAEKKRANNRATSANIRVQINNSADFTTIEMLNVLAKFKEYPIEIFTILSYGQMQYKEQIIEKGKKIFGTRFSYLENNVTPAEYACIVSQNNILVLNQNRQQGLGNSFAALKFGQKLFIRSEVTTFSFFRAHGIKVFPSDKIAEMDFEQFCRLSSEDKKNQTHLVEPFFSDEYLAEKWRPIFKESLC